VIHIGGIKPMEGGGILVLMKDSKEVKFSSLVDYVNEMRCLKYLGNSILVEESPTLHESVTEELIKLPEMDEMKSISPYTDFGNNVVMGEEDEEEEDEDPE